MNGPSPRWLAIDVGNSRVKFGLFDPVSSPDVLPALIETWAIPVGETVPWDRLDFDQQVGQVVIAGANPQEIDRIITGWPVSGVLRPLVLESPEKLPLRTNVPAPEKVGIDRLLNAVAANVLRPVGEPAIIVSCGTATTVDLVNTAGAFEGGAILPGIELGSRSLHDYTALLPLVQMSDIGSPPTNGIGKETHEAIRSGLLWGQLGAIKEVVSRQAPAGSVPLVLLTGGTSPLLAPHFGKSVRCEPDLALRGLALTVVTHQQ